MMHLDSMTHSAVSEMCHLINISMQ